MAVMRITDLPGMDLEMLEGMRQAGVLDRMASASGFLGHWSGRTGTGYRVVEVWDSRDAWQEWFDGTIKPNMPPGIQPTKPTFLDVETEVRPR